MVNGNNNEWDVGMAQIDGLDSFIRAQNERDGKVGPDADARPVILTNPKDKSVDEIVNDVLRHVAAANALSDGNPLIYERGTNIVRVQDGGTEIVDEHELTYILSQVSYWCKSTDRERSMLNTAAVIPPHSIVMIVKRALESRKLLPALTGVYGFPVLRKTGTDRYHIREIGGYHGGIYSEPLIPRKSEMDIDGLPSPREAVDAFRDLWHDIPFESETDFAHALAAVISPMLRPAVGAIPVFPVTKAVPGTGGTFLAQSIGASLTGKILEPIIGKDANEREKTLVSHALGSPSFALFDNLTRIDDSDYLAVSVTSSSLSSRKFHSQQMLHIPITFTSLLTMNGVGLSSDMLRRSAPIRLNRRGVSSPSTWRPPEGWRHNLPYDAAQEKYRWAAIGLVWGWLQNGSPMYEPSEEIGGFRDWARVSNSILTDAGAEGLLGGRKNWLMENDQVGNEWDGFVDWWYENHKSNPLSAKQLLASLDSDSNAPDLPFLVRGEGQAKSRSFSRQLAKSVGRSVNIDNDNRALTVEITRQHRERAAVYFLREITAAPQEMNDGESHCAVHNRLYRTESGCPAC